MSEHERVSEETRQVTRCKPNWSIRRKCYHPKVVGGRENCCGN